MRIAVKILIVCLIVIASGLTLKWHFTNRPVSSNAPPATSPISPTTLVAIEPIKQIPVKCGEWTIIPRVCVGSITVHTSESDLNAIFGENNLKTQKVLIEGYTAPGEAAPEQQTETVLFAHQPEKELVISWTDKGHTQISEIKIRGDKSLWRTSNGITLGTTLKQLEEINGTFFNMYGFGWDGSGQIVSWNDGKLFNEFGEFNSKAARVVSISLRDPDHKNITAEEHDKVTGDKELFSNNPILQRANPPIDAIYIQW